MPVLNHPDSVAPVDREEEQRKKVAAILTERIGVLILATPGVVRLSRSVMSGMSNKNKTRKPAKGIRITIKDNAIRVNIHIVVRFGESIPVIARQIQNEAKILIQRDFPDFDLSGINIRVDGVRFDEVSVSYRNEAIRLLSE